MRIKLSEALVGALSSGPEGWAPLKEFNIESRSYGDPHRFVDLDTLTRPQLERLYATIEPHTKVRGTKTVLKDIDAWNTILDGDSSGTVRNVKQFKAAAIEALRAVPGHRIAKKSDESWFSCYVDKIVYIPKEERRDYVTPEHVNIKLLWKDFGVVKTETVTFYADDVRGYSVVEALGRKNLYPETPERRESYLEDVAKFDVLASQIGRQCTVSGIGTDDLDGNRTDERSWWRRTKRYKLEHGGPSRAVVDVFCETDEDNRKSSSADISYNFWSNSRPAAFDPEDDGEDLSPSPTDRNIEIPIHPYLAMFDLNRHVRLRVHVANVTPYEYQTDLDRCLILPLQVKTFVEMLLAKKSQFKDIIAGKGGGAVILCSGAPGTGKTLTSEVYAEARERPLYSVQASQLGTDPNALEDELLKIFRRAERWNAILLIDEADVYIRRRGEDLHQNAIVGVLLRIFEHYNGILFLTTNRGDVVDDAVASRCLARIEYTIPAPEDQARIWRVLGEVSEVNLSDEDIQRLVVAYPDLSGRDIKMLLKLAQLVGAAQGEPVTVEMIEFVRQFKPTASRESQR